jgi:hypothetical protein
MEQLMDFSNFDRSLAFVLQECYKEIKSSDSKVAEFKKSPTSILTQYLKSKGIDLPQGFHGHAIKAGDPLPEEPKRATVDRFVYIFRESGLFEFKMVPGARDGNDEIMNGSFGACSCCNCCLMEV